MAIDSFNIRVYGVCLNENNEFLVLHEEYAGQYLTKLPGGGLEFGEGTIECLQRELNEELNLKIESVEHFYTQEEFIVSRFKDNQQLLTIYYLVKVKDLNDLLFMDPCIESVEWHAITANPSTLELPVDIVVYKKLQEKFL